MQPNAPSGRLIRKIDKRNLINQKCKVLSYYVGTIADIQKPELCNTLKELEQLLNNEKQRLNSAIYSNVLLMLAMTYYVDLKDYRKASLLFESLLIEDSLKIYSSGIYYFSACDLSRIKPLQEILDKIDINQANIYLRYFYYKYLNGFKITDLVHYLKTEVLDELKENGNQLKIGVFKNQWNLLISESPNKYYKDYYRFIKNFE